jgi:ABC-type bacteriocin/lantibiotic exporter with double-glycine peptidase domain
LTSFAGARPGRGAAAIAQIIFVLASAGWGLTAGQGAPESLRLDVPIMAQEKGLCGAASLAMVFAYWGRGISQYTISSAIGHEAGKGLRGEDLRAYCEQAGFSAYLFQGELDTVRHHLRKGQPVVVAIRARSAKLYHYIVLVGFDEASSAILANDPQAGKLVRMADKKFLALWGRSKFWSLLAVPK